MNNLKKVLLILLVVVGAVFYFKWDSIFPPPVSAIASTNYIGEKEIALIEIPKFYNQRDEKWKDIPLGKTNESVGKVGCLISSIGMNLSYMEMKMNPKVINEKLTAIDGYTSRGWLIWSKLSEITEGKVSVEFPKLSHEKIEEYLLKGKPVLAKVLIHRIIPHWVLIVGKKDGEYLMLDPLTEGKPSNVSGYGNYLYSIRVLEKRS